MKIFVATSNEYPQDNSYFSIVKLKSLFIEKDFKKQEIKDALIMK